VLIGSPFADAFDPASHPLSLQFDLGLVSRYFHLLLGKVEIVRERIRAVIDAERPPRHRRIPPSRPSLIDADYRNQSVTAVHFIVCSLPGDFSPAGGEAVCSVCTVLHAAE
jgi:hypothetical protein